MKQTMILALVGAVNAFKFPFTIGQTVDLLAGLAWGLIEKEEWTQFEGCIQHVHETEEDVADALSHLFTFKPKDWIIAGNDFRKAAFSIPGDIWACTHMANNIKEFGGWISLFFNPSNAKEVIEHNAKRHLPALSNDARKLRRDIKQEEFFQAGVIAGTMLAIVTEPVSSEELALDDGMSELEFDLSLASLLF